MKPYDQLIIRTCKGKDDPVPRLLRMHAHWCGYTGEPDPAMARALAIHIWRLAEVNTSHPIQIIIEAAPHCPDDVLDYWNLLVAALAKRIRWADPNLYPGYKPPPKFRKKQP